VLEALEADAAVADDAGARARAVRELRTLAAQVLDAADPLDLKALAITGADVMKASGRSPGRWLGAVLERLLDEVIEDPRRNDAEALLARARALAATEAG
jgi:hypothetical protein